MFRAIFGRIKPVSFSVRPAVREQIMVGNVLETFTYSHVNTLAMVLRGVVLLGRFAKTIGRHQIDTMFSPIRHPPGNSGDRCRMEICKFCSIYCQEEPERWPRLLSHIEGWLYGTLSDLSGYMPVGLIFDSPCSDFFQEFLNPLNAELNPICHLFVLLIDLTFMGPCIVSIFQYISNKMQRYTIYLYLETAYMFWVVLPPFWVVLPPIIRSAYNYIYSIWYLSHRYCYLPLSWKSWKPV
jgi:hypothetical protein